MSKFWIQTYTGKAFDLLAPSVDAVDPYDIAVSLADKPRYSRHTRLRITVGQHSILCAAAAYRMALGEGLGEHEAVRRARLLALHDAAEAMIGDVLGPARMAIKSLCADLALKYIPPAVLASIPPETFDIFATLDARVSRVIFKRFGIDFDALSSDDRRLIVRIDRSELLYEKTWFVQTPEPRPWGVDGHALQLDLFGGGVRGPAELDRAALVTQPWEFETSVAAYMLLLMRLGLIPQGWAQTLGPDSTVGVGPHGAYFTGYPQGFDIVRQLVPPPAGA